MRNSNITGWKDCGCFKAWTFRIQDCWARFSNRKHRKLVRLACESFHNGRNSFLTRLPGWRPWLSMSTLACNWKRFVHYQNSPNSRPLPWRCVRPTDLRTSSAIMPCGKPVASWLRYGSPKSLPANLISKETSDVCYSLSNQPKQERRFRRW